MSNAREIQSRIKNIRDTMKITNAMYMISSAKLKKAKKSLEDTEPFFYMIQSAINRIDRHFPNMENFYFDQRKEIPEHKRKIGYIVVTADKGLGGSYNHNVIKVAEECLKNGEQNKLYVLGIVGRNYFAKKKVTISEHFSYIVQNPTMSRSRSIAEKMIRRFDRKELDEIHIIYTKLNGAMQTEVEIQQLLPLKKMEFDKIPADVRQEQLALLPDPDAVIQNIIPNYMSGFIFGALVESYSSEQNQRMLAMEAATKNAKEMLRNLEIEYNRVRQAAITQQITEVVSGAKAQKKRKTG